MKAKKKMTMNSKVKTTKQSTKKSTVKENHGSRTLQAHQRIQENPIPNGAPVQEGPRTPNARYVLVQVDQDLNDPGRAVLDACIDAGLGPAVRTVWTDPGYIKNLVNR